MATIAMVSIVFAFNVRSGAQRQFLEYYSILHLDCELCDKLPAGGNIWLLVGSRQQTCCEELSEDLKNINKTSSIINVLISEMSKLTWSRMSFLFSGSRVARLS